MRLPRMLASQALESLTRAHRAEFWARHPPESSRANTGRASGRGAS
jgi:hypothetical protein